MLNKIKKELSGKNKTGQNAAPGGRKTKNIPQKPRLM